MAWRDANAVNDNVCKRSVFVAIVKRMAISRNRQRHRMANENGQRRRVGVLHAANDKSNIPCLL